MKAEMLPNPQAYLKELPDSRRETKNKLHKLEDIHIDVKSNEITAIPKLLELLDIQGVPPSRLMRWVAKKLLPSALLRVVRITF